MYCADRPCDNSIPHPILPPPNPGGCRFESEQLAAAEASHAFIARRGKRTKEEIWREKKAWKEKEDTRLAVLAESSRQRKERAAAANRQKIA
jgi:hypothetical protein